MEPHLPQQSTKSLDQTLRDVLSRRSSIVMAFVFGSLADGRGRADSDLDLAVAGTAELSVQERIALIEELAIAVGRPIDLIDLATTHGLLLQQIVTKGRMIVCRNRSLYAELLRRVAYDDADVMPYYRRILAERRRAWIGT